MSLQGGVLWKEGADTCVFKPAVRCQGEQTRQERHISRIVNATQATRDLKVETFIKKNFPKLVDEELVTVHDKACVPDYDKEDLLFDTRFKMNDSLGCDKLGSITPGVNPTHTNMVTPERGIVFESFLIKNPSFRVTWKSMISDILRASLTMVPDNGPWLIHTDCHLDNVLTIPKGENESPTLSISDWGRSLIIENPNNIESVKQGVREWAESIPYLQIDKSTPDEKIGTLIYERLGERPQHPKFILRSFVDLYTPEFHRRGLNILRAWMPYVLIAQTMSVAQFQVESRASNKAFLDVLFRRFQNSTSQEDLGEAIYDALYNKQGGGMYFPAKYFRGLSTRKAKKRRSELTRRKKMSFKNPKAYVPFSTDKGVKTRKSSYTERFHKKYPGVTSIPSIAKATGISKSILDQVYDRGMAAWRTGHRPGASQQAWGMARVYSFVLKGKTWRTADSDLARKV